MIELPEITPQRLAVKLKTAAERMVRKEHPWVFETGIVKLSKEGEAGDLAIIYDQKKNESMERHESHLKRIDLYGIFPEQ